MNRISKIVGALVAVVVMAAGLTACESAADKASRNLSKDQ